METCAFCNVYDWLIGIAKENAGSFNAVVIQIIDWRAQGHFFEKFAKVFWGHTNTRRQLS